MGTKVFGEGNNIKALLGHVLGVWWRVGIAALASLGFLLACYLFVMRVVIGAPLQCGIISGCDVVQSSKYAFVGIVPVSLIGAVGYLLIWGAALWGTLPSQMQNLRLSGALVGFTTTGFLFSAYLTAIEAFVLKAWCQWCVVSACIATLIFGLSLLELPRLFAAWKHRSTAVGFSSLAGTAQG